MNYKENDTTYITTGTWVDETGKQWQSTLNKTTGTITTEQISTTAIPNQWESCSYRLPCGLCQKTNQPCYYQKWEVTC